MDRRPSPAAAYPDLLESVREIYAEGAQLGSKARGRRLARTYWEVGDAVHTFLLPTSGRPAYGEGVLRRLAEDLSVDVSLAYLMVRFRRRMPNLETFPKLPWSCYIRILPLTSLQEREFYERTAGHGSWTLAQLKGQIKSDLYARALELGSSAVDPHPQRPAPVLRPRRGQLYTYRLKKALPGQHAPHSLTLDQGFDIQWPCNLPGLKNPQAGMIVTAEKRGSGASAHYHFRLNRQRRRKLYTFKAIVERVIDGDTLLVRTDCGFERWFPQRLRLRGIDTPELYSNAGKLARDYVRQIMETIDFIVLCTSARDPYGRYLADVFYLPGGDPETVLTSGVYLNRLLLDENLAQPYV